MSVKQQAVVWELDLPLEQCCVLLALADHAHDDGSNCYPGIRYLAWKVGRSPRTVQRILRALEQARLAVPVAFTQGGRGHATEYRLCLENGRRKPEFSHIAPMRTELKGVTGDTKGVNLSPFSAVKGDTGDGERVTSMTQRVTPVTVKGDTAMSPQPSENHQLTISINHQAAPGCAGPPAPVASAQKPGENEGLRLVRSLGSRRITAGMIGEANTILDLYAAQGRARDLTALAAQWAARGWQWSTFVTAARERLDPADPQTPQPLAFPGAGRSSRQQAQPDTSYTDEWARAENQRQIDIIMAERAARAAAATATVAVGG